MGLTNVDIPILGISGGGEYYLTVYLKFNVDEHELNNDEEEAAAIMLPRARVVDEKARVELQLWVCCVSARMGSSFSTGSLDSSAAPAVPHHVLSTISRQI